MILSCSNICKSFGSDDIIKNASFHIEDHEKAAIVGINGAGKSTLLKIIVGELAPDSGEVVLGSGKTLGYLAQNQDLLSHRTIYEEMLDAKVRHRHGKSSEGSGKFHEDSIRGRAGDHDESVQPFKPRV